MLFDGIAHQVRFGCQAVLMPFFIAGAHLVGGAIDGTAHHDPLIQRNVAFEAAGGKRSEEHTSELQSLMRISYAVCCLKKKKTARCSRHTTYLTISQNLF